ncbi:MAG: hypothetical protein AB7E72_09990 [Lysobacterales bacterium]
MQTLVLIPWLALASPAAVEPAMVQVQTHQLAATTADKAAASGQSLVAEATHAMSARIDASGRVEYHCDVASHQHDSGSSPRDLHEEH